MRTKRHKAIWLRLGGAVSLMVYLVLLFYAQVHVVLEAHEHGEAVHAEHHEPDSEHDHGGDHEHVPHPAADHSLVAATPALGKAEQVLAHGLVTVKEFVLAPAEEVQPSSGWIEDTPKHPPPRLPEQPRSPPLA